MAVLQELGITPVLNEQLKIRLPIAVNSNFCSRTHRLGTVHHVTDRRRQTQSLYGINSATVSTVG